MVWLVWGSGAITPARAGRRRRNGGRSERGGDVCGVALSEVDRGLLEVVCAHRVVTQTQLERLYPDVCERTMRYRTRRLHTLVLLGCSRPYRERGSAPRHLWPTRLADAIGRGQPPPRGGECSGSGPVFVAHAAALSELYVTLVAGPPAGVAPDGFRREREECAKAQSPSTTST